MKNLSKGSFNKLFSHIYVEKKASCHPKAKEILSRFPSSQVILIEHYKDVFCRRGQNFTLQKKSPKLILAVRSSKFIYAGSDMCDSFGNSNFVCSSQIMNCLYDCEYCYLRGMYSSANIVVFVNIEDTFSEVLKILPAYICVSYDSDLLAFEGLAGFVREWLEFCERNPKATIEIRTKGGSLSSIENCKPIPNAMLAWTLSPEPIASKFERGAPSLERRLAQMRRALDAGWKVRLCVDPVLKLNGWREMYGQLAKECKMAVKLTELLGVSVGAFRANSGYFKKMCGLQPDSEIFAYIDGYSSGEAVRYSDEEEIVKYVSELFEIP
ncbi:MAG: radical SAM protein [Clostridiales bacterium]|jgi:spore photoproduct lyase|nr:radical SAM protein [Clostridiales bacterium]